jgi:hypothetical protein
MGYRVKDCTIPKRKERAGRAKASGASTPIPEMIAHVTSVWDEFPEIARPERAAHVTSVWDEIEVTKENPPQQKFLAPKARKQKDPETSSEEEWYNAQETMMDSEESDSQDNFWGDFLKTEATFEEQHSERAEIAVLAPHEMEQLFLAERWEEVHFVFQGWNIEPCKTRKQNPKYYDSFFICGQMNHHSHWFCKGCKAVAYVYKPEANTPCQCEF